MQPSRILDHLSRFPFPHLRPEAARRDRRSRARELAEKALFGGLYGLMRDALRAPGANVFEQLLHALDVWVDIPGGQEERIPASGPLVVCANHPTGLLDGAIAAALVLRRRDDVKILVNRLLPAHEALEPWLIRVDPYARKGSIRRNLPSMRAALEWLRKGAQPTDTVRSLFQKAGIMRRLSEAKEETGAVRAGLAAVEDGREG